ncbi:MAG: xanthine dehydrogenase family protein molybdopterin-binding subunit [Gammaproteobacteria bacterium]|nr:xanthine dehydrogenase family protein molybdopterin-binding subunit [Gammaproteobacteria bacterium]
MSASRESAERVIGRALPRLEDPRFIRGRARYVDDIDLPHTLHAAVLRSPYAHARLVNLDARAARRAPGVAAVFTCADIAGCAAPIPIRLCPDPALQAFLQYPLARERVRYVGEPVALVVAESRACAEDALTSIEVDYDPLPVAADAEASAPPALFEAAPDNVASQLVEAFGDVERAFAEAHHVVRTRFRVARHTAVPVETRGLLAHYDPASERLQVWGPTKVTHFNRTVLAGMLRLPEHRVHLIAPDVGGGFGVRGEFYPEDLLVPFAALRLGRPVKWIEDRLEHLVATNHSRQQIYDLELALATDGRFLGLRARLVNDMGAYLRTHGTIVPGLSAGMLPGPYRWPSYRCEVRCVLTNKTPTGTYRAPGRFEANAARERLIDLAAAELGLDRAAVRATNLIPPDAFPYRTGTHILGEEVVYDSGDYPHALERALALCGWRERPSAGEGRYRTGMGLAAFVEKTGTGPFEGARVSIDGSGHVLVSTGAASVGQGLETCLAQIAADALDADASRVSVRHGDTDLIPYGVGSFASRATVMAGSAVYEACRDLREKLLTVAARMLEAPPETLLFTGSGVRARGGGEYTLAEIAAQAGPAGPAAPDDPGLETVRYFRTQGMAYSHGVVVAEVRVDARTGRVTPRRIWVVYDVGTAVNPRMVAGQVEGGVAQGIGGALLEEFHYDGEGQLLSGSLMEYLLPTATDVPRITLERLERSPSPLNPLGLKGAGEIGIAGVGGAIANAVADALGPAGARVNELPVTPERVWRWLAPEEQSAA